MCESYKGGGETPLRKGVVPMYYLKFILIERRFHPPMVLIISFLSALGVIFTLLAMVIKAYARFLASITCALKEQANVHKAYFEFKRGRIKRKKSQKKNRR